VRCWKLDEGDRLSTPYPESVRFLYALGNEYRTIKLGLERSETLLTALGRPQDACRFVHVAGTNGKGSTCAMIESALRAAGIRTGLYTSPHLSQPTERVRVSGEPVPAERFAQAFDTVHRAVVELEARGAIDMHPTYFETITAMGLVLFRELGAETVVLEVGMGGRLDATNVVSPALSVITPVDFDHEKFLGDTIPKIAFEKAGILKPGVPAVVSSQHPPAMAVIEERAAEVGAPLHHAKDWRVEHLELDAYGSRFEISGPRHLKIDCPLVGAHQVDNARTAVAALHQLGIDDRYIEQGIAAARWPGRLERVASVPDVFLDGAHNPAGARALAGYIRHFHAGRKVWMVFAAMRDKDVHLIGDLLFPLASELILTAPDQARAFQPAEIAALAGVPRARLAPNTAAALALAAEAAPGDAVFITGSLYLVGEARELLARARGAEFDALA
jgi:dihydrofolate synthase/folylpolyglutamate synthase